MLRELNAEQMRGTYRGHIERARLKIAHIVIRSVEENMAVFHGYEKWLNTKDRWSGSALLKLIWAGPISNMRWSNVSIEFVICAPSPNGLIKRAFTDVMDFYAFVCRMPLKKVTPLCLYAWFQDHRPLVDGVGTWRRLIHNKLEFARLNLNYNRKRASVVEAAGGWKHVHGWDDRGCDDFRFAFVVVINSFIYPLFLRSYWCDQNLTVRWCRYVGTPLFVKDLDCQCKFPPLVVLKSDQSYPDQLSWREEEIFTVGNHPKKWRRALAKFAIYVKSCTLDGRRLCEVRPRKWKALNAWRRGSSSH